MIRTEQRGAVMEINFARPEKKNALTVAMYETLVASLAQAEAAPNVRAVILSGDGGTFSAGNDLQDFLANPPSGADSPVFKFLHAISTMDTILIAAVEGRAVGIGVTMLLHCDLAVAAEDAKLSFGFLKMALVPEAASSLIVPELVGGRKAMELFLLRDEFSGAEAAEYGIVNAAVAPGAALETARAYADRVGSLAPTAVRITKRLVRGAPEPIAARIAEEAALFAQQLRSPEAREAFMAFLEKRAPKFG